MHLENGTAEKSTAVWEALAMLRQLETLTVEDSYFNDLDRGYDCNKKRGFFFHSISLMSQIR